MKKTPLAGMIIADGTPISCERLQSLLRHRVIVVLDGAYTWARKLGIAIDYLLGDFDSLAPELLQEAQSKGVKVIHTPDQLQTDLEKGIRWLDSIDVTEIHIVAATGLRLDHTLHNIRLLSRCYRANRRIEIHTDTEKLFLIRDSEMVYSGRVGDKFAVLGAPDCMATTHGLLFDMQDQALSYAHFDSVCNQLASDKVRIAISGSALIIHEK